MSVAWKIIHRSGSLILKRPKGWRAVLYNTSLAKLGIASPLMMPVHVTIEPTNACNLRCPVCETGNDSMERTTGLMRLEEFKQIIDQIHPYVPVLMFYFMGEPFLNRYAYEMIRYARTRGMYVETCTNGEFVDAEGIIYADINKISFQIGGMTQETHEVYRVKGDLERTFEKLYQLLDARRRNPESSVQVEVGFIVMKHNEHEVPEFMRWAEEVGVDVASVIDPCVRTVGQGKEMLPTDKRYWFYDDKAFEQGILKPKRLPNNECTWVWNSVVINWDGSVVPCCRDPNGLHVFGNILETPLKQIWNSKRVVDFRKRIAQNQGEVDICKLCSGYGVPQLMPQRKIGFSVQRLSLDEARIDDLLAASTGRKESAGQKSK